MTYSRRQLYALGEPLGDSVTRKVGGRITYGGGGGDGKTPTSQTITQTTIPTYARPFVERMLGESQALTDISQNPYQSYTGQRFAQFTPLQQQAFQGIAGLQTPGQFGTGTNLATAAGLGALNAGGAFNPYQTGQFTGGAAQQYMSPYMQNVVDVQQQAAQRQADIASQAQKAQFAKSGMFGGSAQAIAGQQAAADLLRQKAGIQAAGLQQAYQQAADQFNREQQLAEQSKQFGAGLGMQGLGLGLQAAGQLGQLGAQQFGAQKDILGLQSQAGAQQQQQVQNILGAQYQDFLNARNYPYQQLAFMSDMLRGLPLTQQASTMYQQPPSMLGQIVGTGIGAYGASGGFKSFGFAEGGGIDATEEKPPVRAFVSANKQRFSDADIESIMGGLGIDRSSLGISLNRMTQSEKDELGRNLMATFSTKLGDVGVNAMVGRRLGGPSGMYSGSLSASYPVGEGRISAGLNAFRSSDGNIRPTGTSFGYSTPVGPGYLSAMLTQPKEGSGRRGQLQYDIPFAEGGGIESPMEFAGHSEPVMRMAYGGSVTDDRFVEATISKLSNAQLQQALQNALNAQDARRAEMIQEELAKRAEAASFQSGLASVAPSNMEDMLPTQESMARGGIVAFAGGELVKDGAYTYEGLETLGKQLEDLRAQVRNAPGSRQLAADPEARARFEAARAALPAKEKEYQDYALKFDPSLGKAAFADVKSRATGARVQPEIAPSLMEPRTGGATPYAYAREGMPESERGQAKYETPAKPAPSKDVAKVASVVSTALAKETGFGKDDLEAVYDRMFNKMNADNAALFKEVRDQIALLAKRPEDIRKDAVRKAITEFGFNMAAAAAQPGVGGGLRGAIRSAAAAAPTFSQSMAESDKAARAAEDVVAKMRLEQARYELAMRKGDQQAAMQHATNIKGLQLQREHIQQQREAAGATAAYRQRALEQQGRQFEQGLGLKGIQAAAQLGQAQARIAAVRRQVLTDFDASNRTLKKQLEDKYGPGSDKANYFYNQKRNDYGEAKVPSVFDLLGEE